MNSLEAIVHAKRLLPKTTELVELVKWGLGEALLDTTLARGYAEVNGGAARFIQRAIDGIDLGETALPLVEYVRPLLHDDQLIEDAESDRKMDKLRQSTDDFRHPPDKRP
jgi:hypothetical protein